MKTNTLRLILSINFIFVGLDLAQSQNSVSEDLTGNWPNQKASTFLISKGSIQNETGFFYDNSENQNLSGNPQISYNLVAEWGEDSPEASCLYALVLPITRLGIPNNL